MKKKKKFDLTHAFVDGFLLFIGSYLAISIVLLGVFFIMGGFKIIPEILYGLIFESSGIFRLSIVVGIIGFLLGGFRSKKK